MIILPCGYWQGSGEILSGSAGPWMLLTTGLSDPLPPLSTHTHYLVLDINPCAYAYIIILFYFNCQCLVFLVDQESWFHFFFHLDGHFLILGVKYTLNLRISPSQKLTAWL